MIREGVEQRGGAKGWSIWRCLVNICPLSHSREEGSSHAKKVAMDTPPSETLVAWRAAVQSASSASQIAVCVNVLDQSISWEKSTSKVVGAPAQGKIWEGKRGRRGRGGGGEEGEEGRRGRGGGGEEGEEGKRGRRGRGGGGEEGEEGKRGRRGRGGGGEEGEEGKRGRRGRGGGGEEGEEGKRGRRGRGRGREEGEEGRRGEDATLQWLLSG